MNIKFKFYKGEEKCPFKDFPNIHFWSIERDIANDPIGVESIYEDTAPADYPEWCKACDDIKERAVAFFIYICVSKFDFSFTEEVAARYFDK